jgi:hypothetical protein
MIRVIQWIQPNVSLLSHFLVWVHGAAENDQALSQNEHIFLQVMCFKTYTLSVLEKAEICLKLGLMEEKNWVPPLAENIYTTSYLG